MFVHPTDAAFYSPVLQRYVTTGQNADWAYVRVHKMLSDDYIAFSKVDRGQVGLAVDGKYIGYMIFTPVYKSADTNSWYGCPLVDTGEYTLNVNSDYISVSGSGSYQCYNFKHPADVITLPLVVNELRIQKSGLSDVKITANISKLQNPRHIDMGLGFTFVPSDLSRFRKIVSSESSIDMSSLSGVVSIPRIFRFYDAIDKYVGHMFDWSDMHGTPFSRVVSFGDRHGVIVGTSGYGSMLDMFIDPLYHVDYSPVPAEHLISGNVSSYNDSQFASIVDITVGVSDSSDVTEYKTETVYVIVDQYNATDGFESGNLIGGYGWYDDNWTKSGTGEISISSIQSHSGTYSVWLAGNTTIGDEYAQLTRYADVNGSMVVNVSFWGFLSAIESGEFCEAWVVDAAGSYARLLRLDDGQDDSTWYRYEYELDSGSYNLDGNLQLMFNSTFNSLGDYWYIDDVNVSWSVITVNDTDGTAISSRWSQVHDPFYDWWLTLKKTSSGTANVTVFAYDMNDSIASSQSVFSSLVGTGWFNVNVSSLMLYEKDIALLNYTNLRFSTDDVHYFSEVLLRREYNDTAVPQFSSCQINDTTLTNYQTARLQCNVTDNLDVDFVNGTVGGVSYEFIKNGDIYYHDFNCLMTDDEINWTLAEAEDIVGQYNSTNPILAYSCIFTPDLIISSPANASELDSEVIVLSVSTNGIVDEWWYSLNGDANVTFTPCAVIVADIGDNELYVWINDTNGNVYFNVSEFEVLTLGTVLVCDVFNEVLIPGESVFSRCNYTYEVNGTPVNGEGICQRTVNTTIIARRFSGNPDSYENVYGYYLGYSIPITSLARNVGGGALGGCNDNTNGSIEMWTTITVNNPFDNLNGTVNISMLNYSYYIGSLSCDDAETYFGAKNDIVEINIAGNDTKFVEMVEALNVTEVYVGMVYGCPACTGVDGDYWTIAVDADNSGHSYYGDVEQTDNWELASYEHFQWIYYQSGTVDMIYNVTTESFDDYRTTSIWDVPGTYDMYFNCSGVNIEEQASLVAYNVSQLSSPVCSIDSYMTDLLSETNQTFSWSAYSTTPFNERYAQIMFGDTLLLDETMPGTYMQYVEEPGVYTITCSVSNIYDTYSQSVNFTVRSLTAELYYSPYVGVGDVTDIYLFLLDENGIPAQVSSEILFTVDELTGNMTWMPDINGYLVEWSPAEVGIYDFTAVVSSYLSASGTILVTEPFNVSVRIWNNINMSDGTQYLNEFAHIYMIRNPTLPMSRRVFERSDISCLPQGDPACYWHGEYVNGEAIITLYEPGNYSLYIVGNNIEWKQWLPSASGTIDCEFCEPWVTQKRFQLGLGEYVFSGPESLDLYYSEPELYVLGLFSGLVTSWLAIAIFFVVGLVFFLFVMWATHSLKSAIAALVLAPSILYLILTMIGVII